MIVTENACNRGMNYLDIGHNPNGGNHVWKYHKGKFFVEEAKDHFEAESLPSFYEYAGQYEEKTKALSLAVHPDKIGQEIPNRVIDELHEHFGDEARIFIFPK